MKVATDLEPPSWKAPYGTVLSIYGGTPLGPTIPSIGLDGFPIGGVNHVEYRNEFGENLLTLEIPLREIRYHDGPQWEAPAIYDELLEKYPTALEKVETTRYPERYGLTEDDDDYCTCCDYDEEEDE